MRNWIIILGIGILILALGIGIYSQRLIIAEIADPGYTPESAAATLIKSQINSPSELRTSSNPIVFAKDDSLNSRAMATASGVVTSSQVCISMGDFFDDSDNDFQDTNPSTTGDIIQYKGSGPLRIKLSVICSEGNKLATDLQKNEIDASTWMQSDKCQELLNLSQTACVVALRFA